MGWKYALSRTKFWLLRERGCPCPLGDKTETKQVIVGLGPEVYFTASAGETQPRKSNIWLIIRRDFSVAVCQTQELKMILNMI